MLNPQVSSKAPTSLPVAQKPMAKDLVPTGQALSPQEVERICKAFIRLLQAPVHEGDANAQR